MNGEKLETDNTWKVDSVKRKGASPSEYVVTLSNEAMKDVQFADKDVVTISIFPYREYFDAMEFSFKVIAKKTVVMTYSFEKIDVA